MKFCKTCGFKVESESDLCPNCHNHTLVETAPYQDFKRKDQFKSLEEDE